MIHFELACAFLQVIFQAIWIKVGLKIFTWLALRGKGPIPKLNHLYAILSLERRIYALFSYYYNQVSTIRPTGQVYFLSPLRRGTLPGEPFLFGDFTFVKLELGPATDGPKPKAECAVFFVFKDFLHIAAGAVFVRNGCSTTVSISTWMCRGRAVKGLGGASSDKSGVLSLMSNISAS